MNECPSCKGEGKIAGFGCGPNVCMKPIVMPCQLCDQTGKVSDEKLDWVRRGRVMREKRVHGSPYKTLRAAAEERGISVVEYSKMEQGVIEPDKEE